MINVLARPCPHCGKPVPADSRAIPFCCEKCQLLDLGAWAAEKYIIPGEKIDKDTRRTTDSSESDEE